MQRNIILGVLAVAGVGVLVTACADESTSPQPAAARSPSAAVAAAQVLPDPFVKRARLDPFFVNQAPELMMRTSVPTDLIIQRLVAAPGSGVWHTHSGPTFSIVDQGRVTITTYDRKNGCVSTTYGPGQTYVEVAGEVHRATVEGSESAVEYKARIYMPPGVPLSTPAADPGCATS